MCRSYHQLLPTLFEGLDDASELLLPDDLLSDGSIAGGFRSQISDSDFEDVEIIGWLYQFYIAEKKDQVIGKVVKSEDIPAATQLFTPNWIVKYMVQNSLGAQWLATYPASALKGQMEYYIEPAEQTDEVKAQLAAITPEALNPEELTLIDPACGSGHILVEAYDLFKAIYLERGYQQREIPQLILEKNLFGLDIDERAAQLTSFALMMKGRGDDRRLFERGIQLNVMALVNSDGLDVEGLANAINLADHGLKLADLVELKQLFEHATTFGSLIQVPDGLAEKLPALRRLSELKGQDMIVAKGLKCLEPLVRQAELLTVRYDAVVANPPYMGSGGMNAILKKFAMETYFDAKSDLFACFIERSYSLGTQLGRLSMVSMQSWMFLSAYRKFREKMIIGKSILSMIQIGYNSFPSMNSKVAQATVFSIINYPIKGLRGCFIDLNTAPQAADKNKLYLERSPKNQYVVAAESFKKIPGSPLAFWASTSTYKAFESKPFTILGAAKIGIQSGDNEAHYRCWHEICLARLYPQIASLSQTRNIKICWVPLQHGGEGRKWFGNNSSVVELGNCGSSILITKNSSLRNSESYFKQAISWNRVSQGRFLPRYVDSGFAFDDVSPFAQPLEPCNLLLLLGQLASNSTALFLKTISTGMKTEIGHVNSLPLPENFFSTKKVEEFVKILVEIGRADWNAYERSWDFQSLPLLSATTDPNPTLESSYTAWIANNKQTIAEMKRLEEENNRLFIDAYGLQDELSPEVPIEQITLTVNPAYRYGGNLSEDELWNRFRQDTIKELLSYATGCMMGRYSLDHPGLILANAGDTLENYVAKVGKSTGELSFQPDRDGIIPVLDGEWFEDDIVARSREFLRVCFPASSLNTDLAYIETDLGKDLRKYFCTDFYKDHLQTYKKRPIYWLVQSPAGPSRGGFACLIYLHRYTKDTLNLVLNNYFRPYLQKLEARQAQLGLDQLNDDLPTRDRTAARKEAEKISKVLKECQAWEQDSLLPLAQQRIELDLDDGVKVNYLKLQDVLAPIPGLAAKEE